jgi:hypothetical protein
MNEINEEDVTFRAIGDNVEVQNVFLYDDGPVRGWRRWIPGRLRRWLGLEPDRLIAWWSVEGDPSDDGE